MARLFPVQKALEPGPQILSQDRFEPDNRRHLGGPAIRTFLNIADEWGLTEEERLKILGFPARSTYFNWVKKARGHETVLLPVDTLLRLSGVLGIYKALGILFEQKADQVGWLRGPHGATLFGNNPPMDLVTSGTPDGIMMVRRYLDAFRGGIFAEPNKAVDQAPLSEDDIVIV